MMQRARRIESWTSRHAATGWFVSEKVNDAFWSLQVHDFRNVPETPALEGLFVNKKTFRFDLSLQDVPSAFSSTGFHRRFQGVPSTYFLPVGY